MTRRRGRRSQYEEDVENVSRGSDGGSGSEDENDDDNDDDDDDDDGNAHNATRNDLLPRRWIYDRVNGDVINTASMSGHQHGHSTLPTPPRPPCFLFYPEPLISCCPGLFETNCLCRAQGKCCVCFCGEDGQDATATTVTCIRSAAMKVVLLFNVYGLLLTVFAALALAKDDARSDLVSVVSFAQTSLQPQLPTSQQPFQQQSDVFDGEFPTVHLDLGLNAMVIDNPNLNASGNSRLSMIAYKDFCKLYFDDDATGFSSGTSQESGMEQFLVSKDTCNDCYDSSIYTSIGILIAVVTQVLTMKHNVTRLYQGYDMNCVKCSTLLWSVVGLAGYTLVVYYFTVCWSSFHNATVSYNRGMLNVLVDYSWRVGTGQICLLTSFGMKVIELGLNCMLPTPSITRSLDEQWEYEKLAGKVNGEGSDANAPSDAHSDVSGNENRGGEESNDVEVVSSSSESTY